MNNHKVSVAQFLRCGTSFDDHFITNLLLNYISRFLDRSTFGKVIGKKVDCLKHPVRCGAVQLKETRHPTYGVYRNCCKSSTLRQEASLWDRQVSII